MSTDGHGHEGPLSGDLPPKPQAWRPTVKGWVNTAGYNGPARPQKRETPPDDALLRAAEAVAARRRSDVGSFVEASAAMAAANAAEQASTRRRRSRA
jgi:hypothetical protein